MLDKTNIRGRRSQPADVALGASIRLRRVTLGLSQQDLADALGVTFQQIQKYENGTNRLAAGRLVTLAKVLDCQPAELLGDAVEASVSATAHPTLIFLSRCDPARHLARAAQILADEGREDIVAALACLAKAITAGMGTQRLPVLNGRTKVQR